MERREDHGHQGAVFPVFHVIDQNKGMNLYLFL